MARERRFSARVAKVLGTTISAPFLFRSVQEAGYGAPVRAARVGKKSMVAISPSFVFPSGIFPGQRMMQGTRIPPS